MPTNPLAATARAVSQPVRGFLNVHFESVKDEVRERNGEQTVTLQQTIASIIEDLVLPPMEAARAQADGLAELFTEQHRRTIALEEVIVELRQTNDQLLAVLAEFAKRPDPVRQPDVD